MSETANASPTKKKRSCLGTLFKTAFAGRLVPQDPDDEPASVLLARIRAERAARPRPARGRRRIGRRAPHADQPVLGLGPDGVA